MRRRRLLAYAALPLLPPVPAILLTVNGKPGEPDEISVLRVPPARTVYLADVMATTVHEGICDDDGRLIVASAPFFGMTAGSGEFYTLDRKVGHIGQTAGRSDIRY